MRLLFVILATIFINFYSNIFADFLHNQKQKVFGGKAAGLSGSYTALSEDGAAAYYNPAIFMEKNSTKLSLSAQSIQKTDDNNDDGYSESSDKQSEQTDVKPAFVGAISSVGFFDLNWGMYVGNVIEYKSSFSGTDVIADSSGRTNTNAKINKQSNEEVSLLGYSLSYNLSKKMAVGIAFSYYSVSSTQGSSYSYNYDYATPTTNMALPSVPLDGNFKGATDRVYLNSANGSGIQLRFGFKYRNNFLRMGVNLAPETTITVKNSVAYEYSTGLQYKGSGGISECNSSTLSAADMKKCMFDREPLYVTESASYEGSYEEKLPTNIKMGIALDFKPVLFSLDLNYTAAAEYQVNTLGITETQQNDGTYKVTLNEGSYLGKKKAVTGFSTGVSFAFSPTLLITGGFFNDPGSREFDKEKLNMQLGMKAVDYSGVTLGFNFVGEGKEEGEKRSETYVGIISTTGKGEIIVEGNDGRPAFKDYSIQDNTIIIAYGAAF